MLDSALDVAMVSVQALILVGLFVVFAFSYSRSGSFLLIKSYHKEAYCSGEGMRRLVLVHVIVSGRRQQHHWKHHVAASHGVGTGVVVLGGISFVACWWVCGGGGSGGVGLLLLVVIVMVIDR